MFLNFTFTQVMIRRRMCEAAPTQEDNTPLQVESVPNESENLIEVPLDISNSDSAIKVELQS